MVTPSLNTLHLQYRIWIAALNYDINVIRIINDHLDEMRKLNEHGMVPGNLAGEQSLKDFRLTIDDLKNELHLAKMQIAALLRNKALQTLPDTQVQEHQFMSNRYHAFRSRFEKMCQQIVGS